MLEQFYRYFGRCFNKSKFGEFIIKSSNSFSRSVSNSTIISFINKDWKEDFLWRRSKTYFIITFPYLKLKNSILPHQENIYHEIDNSFGNKLVKEFINIISNLNTRVIGFSVAAFSLTKIIFTYGSLINNMISMIIYLMLFIVSVTMIIVNRKLTTLYRGSYFLKLVGIIFID